MDSHDLVIIGGGISGMTLAHFAAKRGAKVCVLERKSEVGGCMHSHRTDEGFWFEMGAHTAYNSYQTMLEVIEDVLGLEVLVPRQKAPFRLLEDGEIKSIGKALSKRELLFSVPRLFFTKKDGKTVADYYGAIVGRKNYAEVMTHLFAAVPSQNADAFPADMLFKRRKRRKDAPRSYTIDRGLQRLADAIAENDAIAVETESEVSSIEQGGPTDFVVHTTDGRAFATRHVALAVPPLVGAELVAKARPKLAEALARIACVDIESTGVVVRVAKCELEPVAGIIPTNNEFASAVSRDVVPDGSFRGFAFHFEPGMSEDDRLAKVCDVLGVSRGDLEEVTTNKVQLPSPRLGHKEIVRDIDAAIAGTRWLVTGNYFDGLSLEDCVQRSKSEARRMQ